MNDLTPAAFEAMADYFQSAWPEPPVPAAIESFHAVDCTGCGSEYSLPHYPMVDQIFRCPDCGMSHWVQGYATDEENEVSEAAAG